MDGWAKYNSNMEGGWKYDKAIMNKLKKKVVKYKNEVFKLQVSCVVLGVIAIALFIM